MSIYKATYLLLVLVFPNNCLLTYDFKHSLNCSRQCCQEQKAKIRKVLFALKCVQNPRQPLPADPHHSFVPRSLSYFALTVPTSPPPKHTTHTRPRIFPPIRLTGQTASSYILWRGSQKYWWKDIDRGYWCHDMGLKNTELPTYVTFLNSLCGEVTKYLILQLWKYKEKKIS